ncbi:hypothetical protein GGS21DRAFT_521017 [Xylaria nigripes]|nr:hypothetical protein GGS21DRAFT_521017 [Xylaria nigripes]
MTALPAKYVSQQVLLYFLQSVLPGAACGVMPRRCNVESRFVVGRLVAVYSNTKEDARRHVSVVLDLSWDRLLRYVEHENQDSLS